MELAFVTKALRSQEERSRNRKRCQQYEELVAQVRASDEELAEDEVEMKQALLIAVGRHGQRVASEAVHESLLEALFACESRRALIVSGLSAALAAVVSNRATLVGRALGTLLQLAKRANELKSSRAVVEGVSSLVELCPQGITKLVAAVREHYPWKGAATDSHVSYVRVALALCEKNALLEEFMLQLVVERALELDVEVDLMALSKAAATELSFESIGTQPTLEETSRSVCDAGDHLFELDLEGSKTTPQRPNLEETGESGEQDMATKLDSVMCLVFAYLETRIGPRTKPVGKEAVLTAALDVFEKAVLSTHESKFVQFFVFRLAASSAKRSSRFVSRLLRIVADTSAPNVARIGAVAYLASFVCRAKSVDADLAAHCANCLLCWTLEHARLIWGGATFERRPRGQTSELIPSISQHSLLKPSLATPSTELVQYASHGHQNPRLYYALFQALLYVVCFRGDELFTESTERCCHEAPRAPTRHLNRSLGSLAQFDNWNLLVNLGDGFQRCEPRVRIEFIKVCERAPAVFCSAFIASLSHLRNLVTSEDSEDKQDPELFKKEFFFPFDPYLLPRSRSYIHPVYREWVDIADHRRGRDRGDSDAEQDHTSDDDVDDEDDEKEHRDCATYLGDAASLSQGLRSLDSVSSGPFFVANSKIPHSPASLSPRDMSFDQQHMYESIRPSLSATTASPLFRSLHAPSHVRYDSVSVYGDW